MYNNHSDFNDENNLYHYSYRDSSQQPPQEPVQDLKPHKEKKPAPRWAKITAIILAGAIVSGACGYGGAMLAAVACGAYPSVQACAEALVHAKSTTQPDAALVEKYNARYAVWRKLYPALKVSFAEMEALQ